MSPDMDRISLEIPLARLDDRAVLPTQGSAQAAGWDLYALEETVVPKGSTVLISTGWAAAIPEGWEGQIRCRSSLGKKGMIMPNGLGTIDSDYRGELKVLATWIGEGDSFTVKAGERIAQLLFAPVPPRHPCGDHDGRIGQNRAWRGWIRLIWTILKAR